MADIPFLELPRLCLQMKLEGKRLVTVRERLIVVVRVRGQPRGRVGKVESVSVPMQNLCVAAKGFQAGRRAGLCQPDRSPADLSDVAGIDPAAERLGHQLRAQADSQRGQLPAEAVLDERNFLSYERIALRLVDADRASQHDQKIGIPDGAVCQIVDGCLAERDIPAFAFHDWSQQTHILERDMAERNCRPTMLKHHTDLNLSRNGGGPNSQGLGCPAVAPMPRPGQARSESPVPSRSRR
jgi:hypothetical protein